MSISFYRVSFRAIVIGAFLGAFGGCATTETSPNQSTFYSTGNHFRFNGLQLTELQSQSAHNGASRLTVTGTEDAKAVDQLVAFYAKQASAGIANGDVEQFAVAWHISKLLSQNEIQQEVAASLFTNDLIAKKNGSASLPGGARIFLPSSPYKTTSAASEKSQKVSLFDGEKVITAGGATVFNWEGSPKVAALGDVTNFLNSAIGAAKVLSGGVPANNTPAYSPNVEVIRTMQEGTAYAASDSQGNRYIVEKLRDGVILYNPDNTATLVDLNQLNFIPKVELPDAYRYEAAPIYKNILAFLKTKFDPRTDWDYVSVPPNRIKFGNKSGFINPDGTYSVTENAAAIAAYRTSRAYRFAVDKSSKKDFDDDGLHARIRSQCRTPTWREYHGEAMEYVTYSCIDSSNSVVFSRTYVVSNDVKIQSWNSLLSDKRDAELLKSGNSYAGLASAAAGFSSLLDNVGGMLRCTGLPSTVAGLVNGYSLSTSGGMSKLVSFSPEKEKPSTISSVLNCAQGVVSSSSARADATNGRSLATIEGMVSSKVYKDASSLMKQMDAQYVYGKPAGSASIPSTQFSSPSAEKLAATFYDNLQQTTSLTNLASAVIDR